MLLDSAESLSGIDHRDFNFLWVRDDHEAWGAAEDAVEAGFQGFRVEGGETFVEDDEGGVLEDGAGNVDAAALALGELPAGVAHHFHDAGGHAVEQGAEAEFLADVPGGFGVAGGQRPVAAHEEIELQGGGHDVVFVILGGGGDAAAPGLVADGGGVETLGEEEASGGGAEAGEDVAEGRFAAAGGAFEENAVAGADFHGAVGEDFAVVAGVGVGEIADFEDFAGGGDGLFGGGRAFRRRRRGRAL